MTARVELDYERLSEGALAELIARRDQEALRLIMQRNNQRLFRTAWSILKNRTEAEDAVQSGYLRAFAAIGSFEGRSSLSTWLTRIVINEALVRRRSARRRDAHLDAGSVTVLDHYREKLMAGSATFAAPDAAMARDQVRRILESAVAKLPDTFRPVFVLREVEGLSVDEAAAVLGIKPATVKTRLFRAKQHLRDELAPEMKLLLEGSFPFAGVDCARLTERVLAVLTAPDRSR